MAVSSKRLVHTTTLLQMFKEVGYEAAIMEARARAGTPYKDDPGPSHQPKGTRSQTVPYSLLGHRIAICHQYKLPDGSFGASGKPDPKLVEYQGHVLYSHSQPQGRPCQCAVCSGVPEDWRTVIDEMKNAGLRWER